MNEKEASKLEAEVDDLNEVVRAAVPLGVGREEWLRVTILVAAAHIAEALREIALNVLPHDDTPKGPVRSLFKDDEGEDEL